MSGLGITVSQIGGFLGDHKSYSPHSLHSLMDMDSMLGTILGAILNYKRDPYDHCEGSLKK